MKKRVLALFLSTLLLLTCFGFTVPAAASDGIVRIGVFSDVHDTATGITNVMNNIYAKTNNAPDGVVLVGDIVYLAKDTVPDTAYDTLLANTKVQEMLAANKLVFAMGNHEFPEGSTNEYTDQVRALFTTKTGLNPEHDKLLGGYHFIAAGAMDYAPGTYTDREAWLRETIDAALAEDENKPVFVNLHHPVPNTFYRTGPTDGYNKGVYSDDFMTYIKSQPRLVVFSGHIHHPSSDPKTIWQQENGATFVQTARVAGGNNVTDPYATQEGESRDSQAMMLEINENTNVVTLKRFHVNTSGGTDFGEVWELDIPAMKNGAAGAYQYTDARYDSSKAPSFAGGSTVSVSNLTDASATLTFPAAVPGDASENSLVEYYKIKLHDMDAAMLHSTEVIISDYYEPTRKETDSYTVLGLAPSTNYRAEITAISAFYKESEPIKVDFATAAPEFPEAAYLADPLTQNAAACTDTNVNDDAGHRYGDSFWAMESGHYMTFTFNIEEPGVYRITSSSSSGGVNASLTIDTEEPITKFISTGGFGVKADVIWADYAFTTTGNHTITIRQTGNTASLCTHTMTVGKIAELSAGDIGYQVEKKVIDRSAGLNLGAPNANASAVTSGGYIVWEITPEYTGTYSISVDFSNAGAACSLYTAAYASISEDNKLGTCTATAGYGVSELHEFGSVSMLAGETYTFTLVRETGDTNPYVKSILVQYTDAFDLETDVITLSKAWADRDSTNITSDYAGMDSGKYITWLVDVPVDANYEVIVNCGVHEGIDMTVSVGSKSLTKTLEKTAENNENNAAWYAKKDFNLGTLPLKAGTYTVTVSTANGGTTLFNTVTLRSVGAYALLTDEMTVLGADYSDGYIQAIDAVRISQSNHWAEYEVEVEAGNYALSIVYGAYSSDATAALSVNDIACGTFDLPMNGQYTGGGDPITLTALRLSEGVNTIKFNFSAGTYVVRSFTLTPITTPALSVYSGETADSTKLITSLAEGSMTARALLPRDLNEKPVTMVFALYEGDALYKVKTQNITAKKNSAIAVTLEDVSFTEGKTYTSRVYFIDVLGTLRPYYEPPAEGSLTEA